MDVYKLEASTNLYYINQPGYFYIHFLSGISDKKVLTVYWYGSFSLISSIKLLASSLSPSLWNKSSSSWFL